LHKKLLHQSEFGQSHSVELPKSIHTKFSLLFLDIPTSFYEFWKFETISVIYLNKKEKKRLKQCMAESSPRLQCKARWSAMRSRPEGRLGHGPLARSNRGGGPRATRLCARRARWQSGHRA
jgi:hypothetical protein